MSDVQILATALTERDDADDPLVDEVWEHPPALRVLDCVLSLNRPYDRFVVPRVAELHRRHPEIETTDELIDLIDSYSSPYEFSVAELNYKDERRAETLNGVLRYLQDAQTKFEGDGEEERLSRWAEEVEPEDYRTVGVKDVEALELLEKAAADADVSLRSVDVAIWEERARGSTP